MNNFVLKDRCLEKIETVANALTLEWKSPNFHGKYLLLVEDDDDKKCYFKFFDSTRVEIRTSKGCNKMRRLFETIQTSGIPNFAIQDSDFSRVSGREPKEENYFLTDYHDHEMMCCADKDVVRAIFENLAINFDESIISSTFDDLKMLSNLKWYNYFHHLNINFRGYNVRAKSKDELCSIEEILKDVLPQSSSCTASIDVNNVLEFMKSQSQQDEFEITNGHDFLDKLIQNIEQKYRLNQIRLDVIRTILYASFTFERFRLTDLYSRIFNWTEKINECLFVA